MSIESEDIVGNIREAHRKQCELMRKDVRQQNFTVHRAGLELQNCSYSPEDVKNMATLLKKKKGITQEFLAKLSQALAQSQQNAHSFIAVDGALNSLCSFLTGGEATLQLETTYCIANLALWEDETKSVSPLAKVFGAYLMTLLSSGNPLIQEGCCWALSNMLPEGKIILQAQGLCKKVCELLSSASKNVSNSAIQFLLQLISTGSASSEDTVEVAKGAVLLLAASDQDSSLYWLFFLLSYQQKLDEMMVSNSVHIWAWQKLRMELAGNKSVVAVIPLIRSLVNLCSIHVCSKALLIEKDLGHLLTQLLNFPYESVRKETFILVATILNNMNPEICGMSEYVELREMLEEPMSTVSCLF